MKNFTFAIIAIILFVIISPFGILWQMICNFRNIPEYFFNVAVTFDQSGGVINEHLLNDCLIKKGGEKFGNVDQTISSTLGKNKASSTLTLIGKFIVHILNRLQKNHVEMAIEKDEIDKIKS